MNNDILIGGWCLSAYLYNTSGVQFAYDMFGEDAHTSYLAEYAGTYAESPQRALGKLDNEHFAKLMRIAHERHSKFAEERIALAAME